MKRIGELELAERDRLAVCNAAAILKAAYPVEQVVLFGSKARGTDSPESDIDLLVLTRGDVSRQQKDRMIDAVYDTQLELGVAISPWIVSREEWEHGPLRLLPIHAEIERDGVAA